MQLLDPAVAPLSVLRRLIALDPDNPRYLLSYHSRLAYPFKGIVLVALGLPFVIGNERIRRSRMLGVGLCLVVCAIFYTVEFVANDLGMSRNLPPAAAAWLPTIIFAALGLYLLESVDT